MIKTIAIKLSPSPALVSHLLKKKFIQYSIMTQTLVAEQLELVNIVEVVQSSLVKNFTILNRRLAHHDLLFQQHAASMQQQQQQNTTALTTLQEQMQQHQELVTQRLQDIFRKIQSLEENHQHAKIQTEDTGMGLKRLADELFNTQLQFQERLKVRQNEFADMTARVEMLATEQGRISDEINKKESKVEAEQMLKETQKLRDKNAYIENQLKIAYHKIEKMEILNQKAERLQAKKEVEIMKEIEEKVRKEIKSINSPVPSFSSGQQSAASITQPIKKQTFSSSNERTNNNSITNTSYNRNESSNPNSTQPQSSSNEPQLRQTSTLQQSMYRGDMRSNLDSYLQRWGQKMKAFQQNLKEVNQNLKMLNKFSSKKDTRDNKQNSNEGIKEKINEIKPEVVKLWAKLDTIEDRLCFNQRKLEEKLRAVTDLAAIIKENNVSRLEEKLKNLQTEIFTSIKEIKAKLESKVNQNDYEKYCGKMEDRIVQINEMIYLKSDKLEVKKALLFLQAKIKEIILVISEDQENEKDALLTKKQLKCISCDKELDKFSGVVSSPKGNWDGLPFKDHPPEILGRFGMTSFGSLSKKIKKLEGKDLPVLNKRNVNQSFQNS